MKSQARRSLPSSMFPVVLKQLRAAEDLSQRQLALYLGVSQSAVTRWETGARMPSRDELIRIGHLLRITWTLR